MKLLRFPFASQQLGSPAKYLGEYRLHFRKLDDVVAMVAVVAVVAVAETQNELPTRKAPPSAQRAVLCRAPRRRSFGAASLQASQASRLPLQLQSFRSFHSCEKLFRPGSPVGSAAPQCFPSELNETEPEAESVKLSPCPPRIRNLRSRCSPWEFCRSPAEVRRPPDSTSSRSLNAEQKFLAIRDRCC